MIHTEKCFACDRPIKSRPFVANASDEQVVFVGPDCFKKIHAAGPNGYQPPLGGPKLFFLGVKEAPKGMYSAALKGYAARGGTW